MSTLSPHWTILLVFHHFAYSKMSFQLTSLTVHSYLSALRTKEPNYMFEKSNDPMCKP